MDDKESEDGQDSSKVDEDEVNEQDQSAPSTSCVTKWVIKEIFQRGQWIVPLVYASTD